MYFVLASIPTTHIYISRRTVVGVVFLIWLHGYAPTCASIVIHVDLCFFLRHRASESSPILRQPEPFFCGLSENLERTFLRSKAPSTRCLFSVSQTAEDCFSRLTWVGSASE